MRAVDPFYLGLIFPMKIGFQATAYNGWSVKVNKLIFILIMRFPDCCIYSCPC